MPLSDKYNHNKVMEFASLTVHPSEKVDGEANRLSRLITPADLLGGRGVAMGCFFNTASIFLEPKHFDYFLHSNRALSIPHGSTMSASYGCRYGFGLSSPSRASRRKEQGR